MISQVVIHTKMSKIELVYHDLDNIENNSIFATKIFDITYNNDILIISPYISISFLKNVIGQTNSWKLITDIEEWLKSNVSNVQEIISFIKINSENIHHLKDIHAKAVVSNNRAFFGSANLTEKGLTGRVELNVLLHEIDKVKEIRQWFMSMWSITDEVNFNELENFGKEISSINMNHPKILNKLTSKGPILRSTLPISFRKNLKNMLDEDDENNYDQLVKAVKRLRNKQWANSYFELASKLVEFISIQNDDPRLAMMINSKLQIPISINRGYVLKPYQTGEIGLMMPMNYTRDKFDQDKVSYEDPKRFFKNGVQIARYLKFDCKEGINFTNEMIQYWKSAVIRELNRAKATSMRIYHKSILYKVIINKNLRQKVLEDAFR